MFWRFNYLSSEIDTLLDKEDVTLVEIISEEDVLQECKAQNTKLIDFLTKPENMKDLVKMVINEPSTEVEEKMRYKLPNISCELLTSDVNTITDTLMNTRTLLDDLLGFLDLDEVLNPLQASFFSKVMGLLVMRKSQEFLSYLKSRPTFMDRLLHHLNTSAIMDLLLRLVISMDSPQLRTECLEWLKEEKLIERLIDLIRPMHNSETNYNASFSLCDLIRHGRDQLTFEQDTSVGDVLLKVIQSEESITSLLNFMFEDPTVESSIIGGLSILHTLLEFRKAGMESPFESSTSSLPDVDKFMANIEGTLKALVPRLKDFHQLLTHPPKQHYCPMQTTAGILSLPFGNSRLQVVRLMTYLMVLNYKPINDELVKIGTMGVLLDLFFEYSWNNFLHTQFEHVVSNILTNAVTSLPLNTNNNNNTNLITSPDNTADNTNSNASNCSINMADSATKLIHQLIVDFKLLTRIVEAFEQSEDKLKTPDRRLGYVGHLTKIANNLINNCNAPLLNGVLLNLEKSEVEKWNQFVATTLVEVNKQNSVDATAGSTSSALSNVDDDFRMDFQQVDSSEQKVGRILRLFGCTEDDGLDLEAAMNDANSWTNLSPTTLANSQNKTSMFEDMCESRTEDSEDVAADAASATADVAADDDANNQSEEDIWKEKLANFPESLLKPEVSDKVDPPSSSTDTKKKKSVDNDSDDGDEDDDDEEGSGSSCDKKNKDEVEEMDVSSNDCWANFEEAQTDDAAPIVDKSPWSSSNPPPTVSDDDSNNALSGWADFGKLQDRATSENDDDLGKNNEVNAFASIESGETSLDQTSHHASPVDPPSLANGPV